MLAIVGGSGLTQLASLEVTRREVVRTPYGEPSGALTFGRVCEREVVFLARHGYGHTIPPHLVNYRANLWALKHVDAKGVISVASVGGIRPDFGPGTLVVPDQIIDYTWGRDSTLFDDPNDPLVHVDFSWPFDPVLRRRLRGALERAGLQWVDGGCYAATQGPRLETAAEILRLERDGCDIVGMTGMPEAALAREAGLDYACCAVVVNKAAGRSGGTAIHAEIEATLAQGMADIERLLVAVLPKLK